MSVATTDDFDLRVRIDADRSTLHVHGAVDLLTASTFDAVLDVLVVEGDQPQVVVDLGGVSFMGAAGVGVIASAAERLGTTGRHLAIRSAPALAQRILRLAGLGELVHAGAPEPDAAPLGAEQLAGDRSLVVDGGTTRLATDLARVGSIPASNDIIDGALELVTALASATVQGADGVSVSLERHGRLATVAASNDTVRRMDAHQYGTGEGPCLTAASAGRWFHIESLADEHRWPQFVPLAIEEGIASILSTPLVTPEGPRGSLNIYSNTEGAFGAHEQELAALFATQASGILTRAGADVTDEELDERITDALVAREVIAQAQGVLMARQGIAAPDAAAELRRSARAAEITVQRRAAEVVASTETTGAEQQGHDRV